MGKKKHPPANNARRVIGAKINAAIRKMALRLSAWLEAKTSQLPPARLKVYLILSCVGFAAWNTWLIIDALTVKRAIVRIDRIQTPAHIHNTPGAKSIDPHDLLSDSLLRPGYIDSMQLTKAAYDSMMHDRPGLIDSILQMDRMYYQHHKNR